MRWDEDNTFCYDELCQGDILGGPVGRCLAAAWHAWFSRVWVPDLACDGVHSAKAR